MAAVREVAEETGYVLRRGRVDRSGRAATRGARLLRPDHQPGRGVLPGPGRRFRGGHHRPHGGGATHPAAAPLVGSSRARRDRGLDLAGGVAGAVGRDRRRGRCADRAGRAGGVDRAGRTSRVRSPNGPAAQQWVAATSGGAMPSHLVVGIDGSDESAKALAWAVEDARRRQLDLELVYGLAIPVVSDAYGMVMTRPDIDELCRYSESLLDAARTAAEAMDPSVAVRTRLLNGPPAAVLIDASKEAAGLVVGSRGVGAISGRMLGSVAVRVAAKACCPVYVIPTNYDPAAAGGRSGGGRRRRLGVRRRRAPAGLRRGALPRRLARGRGGLSRAVAGPSGRAEPDRGVPDLGGPAGPANRRRGAGAGPYGFRRRDPGRRPAAGVPSRRRR